MIFDIITIFPDIFSAKGGSASGGKSSCYFDYSIIKRARDKKLIKINIHNLRDYTADRHKTARPPSKPARWRCGRVDDKPYGGGPGMVLKIEPIYKSICSILRNSKSQKSKTKVILLSAKGKKFDQRMAKRFSKLDRLILICGRYEGVDERVAKYIADEEISIGDYVLTGGEIPAMIVIDAVSRLIPGVLGKKESLEEIKGSYPVYTRPPKFSSKRKFRRARPEKLKSWGVPKVLLSGNHKKIKEWREKKKRA